MEVFDDYIATLQNEEQRKKIEHVLSYICEKYPNLKGKIGWSQPMFTHNNAFIIGFSVSKQHMAVSPEQAGMVHFTEEIAKAGYEQSKMLFRIKWTQAVDFALIDAIIEYNIKDKADCKTFWRK